MVLRRLMIGCVLALLLALVPLAALAEASTPAQDAETIHSRLLQAQLDLTRDPAAARQALIDAQATYAVSLAAGLSAQAPEADRVARAALTAADQAIASGDPAALAVARGQLWTALLQGGYRVVVAALSSNDAASARSWLPLREFRHATRFSRPNADATLAVAAAARGEISAADALPAVHADLLDTYQARLTEALGDLSNQQTQTYPARRAELAALAQGYFAILAPAYQEQRGAAPLGVAQQQFAGLRAAAVDGQGIPAALAAVEQTLQGFRAAPLSPAEQARRAGQMLRFLSLVPVEYGRSIRNGRVAVDLEIREAITFRDGAAAAFADLRTLLDARDPDKAAQAAQLFATLEQQLATASAHQDAPTPASVTANAEALDRLLRESMPAEWLKRDNSADFDVIQTALDQMETAVAAGEYELAESARLEAYAILESGPEAKLIVFAPQMKPVIEGLFWYGQDEQKGLAFLIAQRAPRSEIKASRLALNVELEAAQRALVGNNAPAAVASNAAIIVFREGLEAVLILASLMGSLKLGEQRKFRKPLWLGAAMALVASALTWVLAQGMLTVLARYGERLEAVVSLISIAVLLLITNWFFHKVYWTGWIANFHAQKRRLIGGEAGQLLGLVILGFTSIYREGFETVLFLQALVLESGLAVVLGGVGIGLLGTFLIGLVVFVVQAKLPYKRMLIVTGVMIGAVLLQMVGNTVHVLQVIGWLPLHPIRSLELPYWSGLWFGLYATWEGIALQFAAAAFVIGSYFLAEHQQRHRVGPRQGDKPVRLEAHQS